MGAEQDALRRIVARRVTWAGVGGVVLVVAALLLTVAHVAGNVLPTIMGIVGVGCLMAAVASGAMQIADGFRWGRTHRSDDDD